MKKNPLSIALGAALAVSLLTTAALASNPDYVTGDIHKLSIAYEGCPHDMSFEPDVGKSACHVFTVSNYASGKSANPLSGPGWSYDPHTSTLSLNNFRGTAIYLLGSFAYDTEHKTPTVNIKLSGDNVLTDNGEQLQAPLHAEMVNLIVSGPGTLTLNGVAGGLFATPNGGDYKENAYDGGRITLKDGVKLYTNSNSVYSSGSLRADELVVGAGCLVDIDGSTLDSASSMGNLVVNGTLIARSNVETTFNLSIRAGYCTVAPNVTIKGGRDAATATVMKTRDPQTSPIYGAVTILDRDDAKTYPYVEFREGGVTVPETPVTPAAPMALARTQMITLNGKPIEFQAYAIKDGSGNETNYVKLRDVAYAMMDGGVQFSVGWSGKVSIKQGATYVPNGTEMTTPFSGDRAYAVSTTPTLMGDYESVMEAIVITDDQGAGYTYYKLRDLGRTMGFEVNWSADKGVTVDTP